jgi:hypothetical protein
MGQLSFDNSHDVKVPPGEITQDGNLATCVRQVVATQVVKPAKTDTHDGDGLWKIVFGAVSSVSAPLAEPKH